MSKKVAILITVAAVALAYAFLLVALPALADYMTSCSTSAGGVFTAPMAMYFVPGVIGVIVIILIIRQTKKEAKKDE